MKVLLLLTLLCSCASNQKEPWAVGDCVKHDPRGAWFEILEVKKHDEYYYVLKLIKEDNKEIVLTKINCDSIPNSPKGKTLEN